MDSAIIKKLDTFFSKYPQQEFPKHHTLIEAGQVPSSIFYIEAGIVRQYWIFENGTEATLNLYKPHSFLPMSWAIGNVVNQHIYEAMTGITIRKVPKDDLLVFLKNEPDIVYDLLKRMYVGMEGLWQHMESLANGSSLTKLTASLIILAKRFGKKENGTTIISLKLSEQELANYAGMSRETVSRELQKLKKEKIVSFNKGYIAIQNEEKLQAHLLT